MQATTELSPFLPGTHIQYAWDSTSLGWFKQCPRLYQYSMIEGWRKRGANVHLQFGIWYHGALDYYYKLRIDEKVSGLGRVCEHDEALRKVVLVALRTTWEYPEEDQVVSRPWESDEPTKTRETLVRSIIWYLDQFKDDPAETLVLASGQPAVELSFRMELDWGPTSAQPYILCGHLDRVVEYGGQKYVMDHKTTKGALSAYYFDGFAPDNQMTIYTIAAKAQFATPVAGVILDAAQLAVGFTRFQRGFTYRTVTQCDEWLEDLKHWLTLAETYATLSHWPMNDKACGLFGGCTFRHVCAKSPEVRQKFLESDFVRHPWNPLTVR